MTGNIPKYSSFCDIKQNVDEFRVVLKFDSTNNFESRIDKMCWRWNTSRIDNQTLTFGHECPKAEYPDTHSRWAVFAPAQDGQAMEDRMTWIFRDSASTKSISVDFQQVALRWGFRYVHFDVCAAYIHYIHCVHT